VEDALLVPQQAVSRDAAGQAQVSLVDGDGKLVRQLVTAERAVGDQWLITAGLKSGDRVAVEGQQKVAPGSTVRAVPVAAAKSVAQR
jgi:membrane fusion protein (multidrug efflux system)